MILIRRWAPLGLLTIIITFLVVPKFFLSGNDSGTSGARAFTPKAQPVRTVVASLSDFEQSREFSGTLLAYDGVDLKPEVSGKVIEILFQEGTTVEKGDLLLRLNNADLQAELLAADYNLALAELQSKRQIRLLNSESTTQEAADEARIRVKTLEAQKALIQARIDKTEIRAPFTGKIGLRLISEGAVIDSGTVIATLQKIDALKVDFALPERFLSILKVGKPIKVMVDGQPNKFTGKIVAVNPKIDVSTRTILSRAEVQNEKEMLYPGGFARVELSLNDFKDIILIPSTAVQQSINAQTVFVVEDGKAAIRKIKTGLRTADQVVVTEGLNPGDEVIVIGTQSLRQGSPVNVIQ